jgi:hypothetical protein
VAEIQLCSSGYFVSWLVRTAAVEPPSYTFTGRLQAQSYIQGILITLAGVDPNAPVDVASDPVGVGPGDPYWGPSVTTTVPGDDLLFGAAHGGALTWSVPGTMSLVATTGTLVLFHGTAASAGATPIVKTSPSDSNPGCGAVEVIALRAAH